MERMGARLKEDVIRLSEDAQRLVQAYVEHGVTVQDAAEMAGLSLLEKVRVLSELRRAGVLSGDTADTLVIKDWAGVLPCLDQEKKDEDERAFLPADDYPPHGLRCSAIREEGGDMPLPERKKDEEKINDEKDHDLTSLSFPSHFISYRYTGAKAAELEYPEPYIGWFKQGTIIAKDSESFWALSDYYQDYANGVRGTFIQADRMRSTGLGIPGEIGQERRNKQKALIRQAWGVFFRYNHPLSDLYAKKLLIACGNNSEMVLDYMAHVAPRLHLPENFSEKGKPIKYPHAYMMELIEKEKQGIPVDKRIEEIIF